jgi:hypothetical protein
MFASKTYRASGSFDRLRKQLGEVISPWAGRSKDLWCCAGPGRAGAYVDAQNRIYVADQYNHRIHVFQYPGGDGAGDAGTARTPEDDEAPEDERG